MDFVFFTRPHELDQIFAHLRNVSSLQDDFPLASLPLLGYTVGTPEESDGIHKEYVFKLQFKSHVYFFRAESEYTFERYVERVCEVWGNQQRHRDNDTV